MHNDEEGVVSTKWMISEKVNGNKKSAECVSHISKMQELYVMLRLMAVMMCSMFFKNESKNTEYMNTELKKHCIIKNHKGELQGAWQDFLKIFYSAGNMSGCERMVT